MIFHLDNTIKKQSQEAILTLAEAMVLACDNHHFIIRDKLVDWIDEEIMNSQLYLGKLAKMKLQSNHELFFPKKCHKKYLQNITVGYGKNMINIEQMHKMAMLPSYVILENGKYDWSMFEKWVFLYRNDDCFETINKMVNTAIYDGQLLPDNGGGKTNIPNQAYIRTSLYPTSELKLYSYKLLAIFDSDKTSDTDLFDHNNDIKTKLDKLKVEFYELRKRKIENYFPFETYKAVGLANAVNRPVGLTELDWDYCNLNDNKSFIEKNGQTIRVQDFLKKFEKTHVVDLSNSLTEQQLKQRIAHDNPINGHDEVQETILKMAKLI